MRSKLVYAALLTLIIGLILTACGANNENPGPTEYEAEPYTINTYGDSPLASVGILRAAPMIASPLQPLEGYIGFPSLHIVSDYDPFAVARSFWHNGVVTLWGADETYNFNNAAVSIRGRGNTAWSSEKMPLQLRFPEPRTMFGSEYAHREWILLANLFDPALTRNHNALYLSSLLENLDFTPWAQFVHLYVNGEYMGLYQLTDDKTPAPGRGPLVFDPDPAISEFMFEMDSRLLDGPAAGLDPNLDFFTAGVGEEERAYYIHFPMHSNWDGHLEYLRGHIRYVDDIIRSRGFEAIAQVIDIPSFLDFFLVQEFMKNADVGVYNVFMSLRGQGEERRVYFGPVWDFDRSAGNAIYLADYTHVHAAVHNNWFRHLLSTPEIFAMAGERWLQIKDGLIRQMIDNAAYITTSYEASFLRNFERHSILGASPEPDWFAVIPQQIREIGTFYGQIEYLLDWYEKRVYGLTAFFDGRYNWLNQWWDDIAAQETTVPLPSLHLTTYYDPFTVERNFWHNGTAFVSGAALEQNFDPAGVRIRGRGNSTWRNGEDKRPLRIRFDEARPMLGSPYAATDWILLANHFDRTLLRNYTALNLGSALGGLDFTPVPRHVHLYVNGEYMGVYLLTDERDIGPGRMQLEWNEDPAVSGFFLELDARAPDSGILDETFIMVNGLPYDLRWPDNLSTYHVDYVRDYLIAVCHAIRTQGFDDILALIDLDSFVDFYIVQEFFKDVDARDLSIFMYITGTGDERRLFKGPIWDFDLAMGNASYQPLGYGPEGLYVAIFNYWYRYLMRMPEFFNAVQTRWNEIADREIAQTITRTRETAVRSRLEFERNFERHPEVMGREQMPTPQDILEIDYFMGHVEHLLNWLETRASWLDDFLNSGLSEFDHMWVLVEYHAYHRPISIDINGEAHNLNITPINLQNRIMLPVEEIADLFGLTVSYQPNTRAVVLTRDDTIITHRVGDLFITVNWERVDIGVPSSLYIRDYLFIPLRAIAEALGYEIHWNRLTRTVLINSP
ncbi:MAG: CotH kinase family protein [Defluviitaleaceae bacterium]|nr:CotH kinase family protein [Defluviitaleaceae bacterium]